MKEGNKKLCGEGCVVHNDTQTGVDCSTQTAGDYSTQTAGYESTQTAGRYSTQTADFGSIQKAGYRSTQTADFGSTQTAGYYSTQKAGFYSTQTAGDRSTQTAGYYSTQVTGKNSFVNINAKENTYNIVKCDRNCIISIIGDGVANTIASSVPAIYVIDGSNGEVVEKYDHGHDLNEIKNKWFK